MRSKMAILIIDDHPAMRTTLKDILEEEGYDINTADTGTQGIESCRKKKYDLILLDVRLPDLNGVEVFKHLKTVCKNPRVIMMSAYTMDELKREALKEGAIAFLQKPLDIEKVLSIIKDEEYPQVLIVMDDRKERKKLGAKLSRENYRVYMSDSPEDSLELARQIKFSLIVIDTALRSISAMTIFLELKKISPDSITILFTEAKKESIEIAKEAVRQNAYTYIEKPVNIDKLLSTLDTIKQQQRSNFVQKPGDAYGNNFK